MAKSALLLAFTLAAVGCGGSGSSTTGDTPPPDMTSAGTGGGPSILGQHGTVVDYFKLTPLAGFTVTDGVNTTTTDADGKWVLPQPVGSELAPSVTGPGYSTLQLAKVRAVAEDIDVGPVPIPDVMSLGLEANILGADTAKALVQVIIQPTGACTSVAGGTLSVISPADAKVAYFSSMALPTASAFSDVTSNRPVAVVYDIDPTAAALEVTMTHPTCKLSAPDATYKGGQFDGVGKLAPIEPGDVNSTLFLLAE
jgi:hypothetical protein